MLKWFTHEGNKFSVDEVLEKGLLSDSYPMAYLRECASEREWVGIPSTTQLINGSRLEFLKLMTPYAIDPDDQSFRIIGTRAHHKLEKMAPVTSFTELKIPVSENEVSGTSDLLEEQPNGEWWLTDYKTWGSYKIGMCLGLVKKKRPMIDEDGQPVVYKVNSKYGKKGDPRMEDYYEADPEAIDMKEVELQINRYRIMIEQYFGIKVDRMKVFAAVRDGNTQVAKGRGIPLNTYYIDVKRIDDEKIWEYFEQKRNTLLNAIKDYSGDAMTTPEYTDQYFEGLKQSCPPECTNKESWDGRRCEKYCPVAEMCQKIGCSYLGTGEE